MGAPQNAFQKSLMKPANDRFLDQSQSAGKYTSADERYVRRFGSALLLHWDELSEDLRSKIVADAISAWDRELDIPHIARKLDAFVKRHLARFPQKLSD
jgi:hypothetical protein